MTLVVGERGLSPPMRRLCAAVVFVDSKIEHVSAICGFLSPAARRSIDEVKVFM
ncbi:MAG: hypothetical protein HQL64_06915 [Magnetococcales bacterium]|nr:hypothetical protein [Magnetococcales bacterium]